MKIAVFGHKNPDTDSICASLTFSALKNQLGLDTVAFRLGPLNRESSFVLDYFHLAPPPLLPSVKRQVSDLCYTQIMPLTPESSFMEAFQYMAQEGIKTLPIQEEKGRLIGILTMKDIAMEMMQADPYLLDTNLGAIVKGLQGRLLTQQPLDTRITCRIVVAALQRESFLSFLQEPNVAILVGDRKEILESAIDLGCPLLLATGINTVLPQSLLEKAAQKKVAVVHLPHDTYYAAKMLQQCNFIRKAMKSSVVQFTPEQYLDSIQDDMISHNYRNYPVVDEQGVFLGMIGRRHLLRAGRKQVILVDHNELSQSAEGIEDAEILEIIDHHKIGGLQTMLPMRFTNLPVGSTCTMIAQEYQREGIAPSTTQAGLLISGILSDTLYFKSPTCTSQDQKMVQWLNQTAQLDIDTYARELFEAGTDISGVSALDLFYRDFKDFSISGLSVCISQIFLLDITRLQTIESDLLQVMEKIRFSQDYDIALLAVTDILQEGSYLYYSAYASSVIALAFIGSEQQGQFIAGLLSRKKQIVPALGNAILQLGQPLS